MRRRLRRDPVVKKIEVLSLQPGDVLVICYPHKFRPETFDAVKERAQRAFGTEVPVVVLDQGADLKVLRETPSP